MYLKGRWSLAIHSNPGSLCSDLVFQKSAEWPVKTDLPLQVRRAAQWVKACLDFFAELEQETLQPDTFKGQPLDMSSYLFMSATTRIPMRFRDALVRSPLSRHIVVLRDGEFFKVQVLDANRKAYSALTIAKLLNQVVQSKAKRGVVGLASLTSMDRDSWSDVYTDLKHTNLSAMNDIGGALFHVVLDAEDDSQKSRNEKVRSSLYGNTINRWFDQSLTLIINNHEIGTHFEHSWGDGLSVLRLSKDTLEKVRDWKISDFGENQSVPPDHVKKIEFSNVSPNVIAKQQESQRNLAQLAQKLGLESRIFSDFGTDHLKSLKVSPDGFFQQAIQLAYRRLHGKTVATYESCSTQTFLGGRTETIRSATPESYAFVMEFMDCLGGDDKRKNQLLRTAIQKHSELGSEAATGRGFDRHLFALKKVAEAKGKTLPDLLTGKGYSLLEKNILSTSTLSQEFSEQASFGPVVETGLGICYHFFNNRIHFCVTSYQGDAVRMCNKIEESLVELERCLKY